MAKKDKKEEQETKKQKLARARRTIERFKKKNEDANVSIGSEDFGRIETVSTGVWSLDRLIKGLPRGLFTHIAGPSSAGKAQKLSSRVRTKDGWLTIGSLKIGDEVCNPYGGISKVRDIIPQGIRTSYEIKLYDGRTAESCDEHLWLVFSPDWSESGFYKVLPLNDVKNYLKSHRVYIPLPKAVCGNEIDNPIISPYTLGILIGDGCFGSSVPQFTTTDIEVVNHIKLSIPKNLIVKKIGHSISYSISTGKKGGIKNSNIILNEIRRLNLFGKRAWEKHIPSEYLYSSIEQRKHLLGGLIDSDGTVCKNGSVSYSTTSKILAYDVQELVRSLGGVCSICEKNSFFKDPSGNKKQGRLSYVCHLFYLDFNSIIRLERKRLRLSKKSRNLNRVIRIESIEEKAKEEMKCISVEGELYITDNYVVTHNSTLALRIIGLLQKEGMVCALANNERRYSQEWARANGVNTDELLGGNFTNLEQCQDFMIEIANDKSCDCIVVDTITALASAGELADKRGDRSTADNTMAQIPRKLSQFFRMATARIHDSKMVVILINQIRTGGLGTSYIRDISVGGHALEHAKSLDLFLRRTSRDEWPQIDDKIYLGHTINATILKCTHTMSASEGDKININFFKGRGFDDDYDVVYHARELGIITNESKGYFDYKDNSGKEHRIQSRAVCADSNLKEYFLKEDLIGELKEKIAEKPVTRSPLGDKIDLGDTSEAEE